MTLRISAAATTSASLEAAWDAITDWAGQGRWIPLTTVKVGEQTAGIGLRAAAFSGVTILKPGSQSVRAALRGSKGVVPLCFQNKGLRIGLLDRFVVTGWSPPTELEVLHVGPAFYGEGIFTLTELPNGTEIRCTEVFALPGGRLTETLVRPGLPLFRRGLSHSLRMLTRVLEETR